MPPLVTTSPFGSITHQNGLVVTNQRGIGLATSVEVQFSSTLKVAGTVVVTDPAKDVAVVRIAPAIAATVKPVPMGCAETLPAPADGDQIFAIESPLRQVRRTTSGVVRLIDANTIEADIVQSLGGSGGLVFTARGTAIGMTSEVADADRQRTPDVRLIRLSDVCTVIALARTKVDGIAAPTATPLPVEPDQEDTSEDARGHRRAPRGQPESVSDIGVRFRRRVPDTSPRLRGQAANGGVEPGDSAG